MAGGDDLPDGAGDDLRRGVAPTVRLAAHGSGHGPDLIGIGTALGRGLQVVGGDRRPLGANAAGLDHDDVDAEGAQFHAQGVAQGLDGVLGGVVPAAQRRGQLPAHGGDVDDGA